MIKVVDLNTFEVLTIDSALDNWFSVIIYDECDKYKGSLTGTPRWMFGMDFDMDSIAFLHYKQQHQLAAELIDFGIKEYLKDKDPKFSAGFANVHLENLFAVTDSKFFDLLKAKYMSMVADDKIKDLLH